MNDLMRAIYLALCSNPQKPKDIAKMAVLVQDVIATDEGYEFVEKYCKKGGNYLYGEYMKERTKRIFGKVSGDGGLLL